MLKADGILILPEDLNNLLFEKINLLNELDNVITDELILKFLDELKYIGYTATTELGIAKDVYNQLMNELFHPTKNWSKKYNYSGSVCYYFNDLKWSSLYVDTAFINFFIKNYLEEDDYFLFVQYSNGNVAIQGYYNDLAYNEFEELNPTFRSFITFSKIVNNKE